MVILIILSVIVIFFTILSERRKKKAAEERIKQNKIRAAREKHLNLEKNVLCEDGITRVYRNRMYGIIKEEVWPTKPNIDLAANNPKKHYGKQKKRVYQVLEQNHGFCEVKGEILHELTRHFNISSISIQSYQSWGGAKISGVEFKKSNWFSEEGKILSKKEIIAGNNFYHAKTAGERVRVNLTTSAMKSLVFHEINGHYFVYNYWQLHALRPFNGLINKVKYVDGEPVGVKHVKTSQSIKKDVGTKQYSLDDGHPPVLDTFIPDSKLFKRDMTGLRQYFNEMPNMERIFNEFTHSIRNGYSIETYLSKANLMNDSETRQIAGKGFSTIAGFLSDMLNIQENEELRKDLEACKEAQKILLNLKED